MHPQLAAYPAQWAEPPALPPLEPDAVHLCLLPLPAGPGLPRAAAYTQARQQAAAALGALLKHYGGDDDGRAPQLRFGPHGKPALHPQTRPPLQFNYTYSGAWALYAFARHRDLGVDLEIPPRRFINPVRLAASRLTPAEQHAWRALPAAHRDTALLACWTRKEAHGKALGCGVRYAMQDTCLFAAPGRWDWQTDGRAGRVCGLQLAMPGGALAALAYTGQPLDTARLHTYRLAPAALPALAA